MSPTLGDIERGLSAYYTRFDRDRCADAVALARYAADDLSAAERLEFEDHFNQCSECRADLESFTSVADIWDAGEPAPEGILARLLGFWSLPRLALAASAAVLALVLVLVPFGPREKERVLVPKGTWQLHVAAERSGHTFRVQDGSILQTGDQLGFFYTAERPGYLMILYADEEGEIVRLFPALKPQSAIAAEGKNIRIPDGAELSPGEGCEWVLGLFSDQPFTGDQAREAVGRMLGERKGCRLDASSAKLHGVGIQVIQVNR
jgi:hypothetical protein